MITNAFKKAMMLMLTNSSNRNKSSNALAAKTINGSTYYLNKLSGWPVYNMSTTVRVSSSAYAGIWIGSGTTPPTADDYSLEERITSNASGTATISGDYIDSDGNPTLKMVVTITNTGSDSITISEIGFFQSINAATSVSASGSDAVFMLDRTLLNTPVSIPAGESAAITYTLKTVIV